MNDTRYQPESHIYTHAILSFIGMNVVSQTTHVVPASGLWIEEPVRTGQTDSQHCQHWDAWLSLEHIVFCYYATELSGPLLRRDVAPTARSSSIR